MMQEILMLLSTIDSDGCPSDDTAEDVLGECDPLPFPSDVEYLQVLTSDGLAELKRRIRAKLSSRRYSRRRKEDAKLQTTQSTEHSEELRKLRALRTMLEQGTTVSSSQLRDELDVLLRTTQLSANQTFHLYEQLYPGSREADRFDPRPDLLPLVEDVSVELTPSMQFKLALANVQTILRDLANSARCNRSGCVVTTFKGWRITEDKRRGSRLCSTASRKVYGMLRAALAEAVWENADDVSKRVSTAAYYSSFATVTARSLEVEDEEPCVFYSEEHHEFPDPFLGRSFASIHGAQDREDGFWYVKQSLKGPTLRPESLCGSEIISTVIQDGTSEDGAAFVTVDLIVLYGLSHLQSLVSRDPPLCHRVLDQWERSHLSSTASATASIGACNGDAVSRKRLSL